MVQLWPGLTTAPDMQVPPVGMVKVPFPVPPVLAIVGLVVNVNGPAFAPVALLRVIVPFFVDVPPVFNAGVGADKLTVARTPVPESTTCALPPPWPVTVALMVPSLKPVVVGWNCTETVQLAPAASVKGVVAAQLLKLRAVNWLPVRLTAVMVSGVVPKLLKVVLIAALDVPTDVFGKASASGFASSKPVPLS